MAVNRDEFFAELDKLTDQEIEERLPLFDREQLLLVQQYIDRRGEEPQDHYRGRHRTVRRFPSRVAIPGTRPLSP